MNPRLAAARALTAVLAGKASLGSSLPPQLDKVAARDRGLAQDLAFGAARWQPRLSLLADKLLEKPLKAGDRDVEALLLIGLYQLFYTRIPAHAAIGETVGCAATLKKPWAKGLLNAVLRAAQRDGAELLSQMENDPVVRTAHPRWLQKALKANWPEHWEAICQANNEHPPLILRINQRRIRHHRLADNSHLGFSQGIGNDRKLRYISRTAGSGRNAHQRRYRVLNQVNAFKLFDAALMAHFYPDGFGAVHRTAAAYSDDHITTGGRIET